MPIQALSVFACLPEKQGLGYLQSQCILPRQVYSAKLAQARSKYGRSMPQAGNPDILDIPLQYSAYLEKVKTNPRFIETVGNGRLSYSFRLVEIEPLLAIQLHISLEHLREKCDTLDEMLQVCLPHEVNDVSIEPPLCDKNGVTITSIDLNTRLYSNQVQLVYASPDKKMALMGLIIGVGSPLVQVVKFENRYYLKNGYHRVYGLRKGGASHIPCILLEAENELDVGITEGTIPMNILKSNNPPTMGHFTNGRAFPLPLKRFKRQIRFSWAETVDGGE